MKLSIGMPPKQVCDTLGMPAREIASALAAAYEDGYAIVGDNVVGNRDARVVFTGSYAPDATEFHAGTALYAVRR